MGEEKRRSKDEDVLAQSRREPLLAIYKNGNNSKVLASARGCGIRGVGAEGPGEEGGGGGEEEGRAEG